MGFGLRVLLITRITQPATLKKGTTEITATPLESSYLIKSLPQLSAQFAFIR